MNIEPVAAALPPGLYTYSDASAIIGPAIRARQKCDVDAILEAMAHYGLIQRVVGAGGPYGVRDVLRLPPPTDASPVRPTRQTCIAITDEWGSVRDFPVGEKADAEIARVKQVKLRAERARLTSILGADA
jgi:hypothetical protein